MGTTAQKLEYLGTTKSQLKDMINYGLDDNNKITSSTTFRNYVTSVFKAFLESLNNPDTLFTNLPKVSDTGTNITLNDTANAPMRIMLNATDITQAGTPTPDSPQDIHTISGSNKVVVNGKNLFDGSRNVNSTFTASVSTALEHFKATGEYATGYCDNTNKINAYAGTYETCFIQVAPNTTYRLSSQGAENNGFSCIICLDNNGNSLQASSNWQGANYTINTPAGTKYLMFSPRNANVMYVQLEYGETTTTYEPYISQEADIDLSSKNLISVPEYYPVTAGPVVLDLKTPVPAGTYTISIKEFINGGTTKGLIHFLDSSNTQLTYTALDNTTKSATITVSSPIAKLRLYSQNSAGASTGITSTYVGLMLSTSGGEYQEYYTPIEYCKIGNYEDKFIRTSGKNLFDNSKVEIGKAWHGGTAEKRARFYIKLPAGTAYSIRVDDFTNLNEVAIVECASINPPASKTYYTLVKTSAFTMTHTFDSSATYLSIQFQSPNTFTQTMADSIKLMLNYGSTALPYEPYGSNEWYIKKNIGKYVANNDLTGNGTSDTTVSLITPALNISASLGGTALANISKNNLLSGYSSTGINTLNGTTGTKCIRIVLSKDYCSDYATANTFLANNNFTIYYQMATPTYTQITGTLAEQLEYVYQLLKSYKGVTNISQVNNDLPFELDVQAIEDME